MGVVNGCVANRSAVLSTRSAYAITRCTNDGDCVATLDEVPTEHALDIYVNGVKALNVACTPTFLKELVVGRLLTEGLIGGLSDIAELSFGGGSPSLVRITLKRSVSLSGYSDACPAVTTCGSKEIPSFWTRMRAPLRDLSPIAWNPDDVFSLACEFAADTPIHRATFGSHSCRLAVGNELLYCCEDLGRHNAFDKVVGCALLDGVDLSKATLFTSGRAPVDMVEKAIRARVPILVSKAVPTNRTVELARRYGLTLVCSARPDSMKVFSDPLGCTYRAATA